MKPSGFRTYESAWRINVAPRWGSTAIADIRYSEVQSWVVVDVLAVSAEGKGRDAVLWPSHSGGHLPPPTNKSWLSGAVERCQRAAPTFPRITAHDLRHTAASLAI